MKLAQKIQEIIEGDVSYDEETLEKFSRDTSIFKVTPQLVVAPKNKKDLKAIVNFVSNNRNEFPNLSITGRAGGTDMTGGSIGEGIILDFSKYFNHQEIDLDNLELDVEPGVFFRDFEKEADKDHITMPVYPASKSIAAYGGMIMNNCGGENTLRYGQMRNFVNEMNVILSNGEEFILRPLNKEELEHKISLNNYEGEIYRKTFDLINSNYELLKSAKPKVAKNSSGYALWDVYNKETGVFDLSQLFVGSQGTLGLMTNARVRLVEKQEHRRLVTFFFKDWSKLPDIVNKILPVGVQSMETFDDTTLKLGLRFMPEIAKKTGTSFFKFAFQFIPEVLIGIKMLGLPKLVVLVDITEESSRDADAKVNKIIDLMKDQKVNYRVIKDMKEGEKYWTMRRESFNLLRQKVKNKQTAPFIDDFCVLPQKLPEFLPKFLKILNDNGIKINIVGHAGSGNLHIIPLMNLKKETEREKISKVSDEVYDLIIEYGGTITAEHNDGIIRTPYVAKMFGEEVYGLFEEVKNIFDPNNIFNPGKKVGGTIEYMKSHIVAK